jgi:hypothetical protein
MQGLLFTPEGFETRVLQPPSGRIGLAGCGADRKSPYRVMLPFVCEQASWNRVRQVYQTTVFVMRGRVGARVINRILADART